MKLEPVPLSEAKRKILGHNIAGANCPRGIQAALPYIDDFPPVHNLASLEDLANRLADLNRRSNGSGYPATEAKKPKHIGQRVHKG